MGLRDDDILDDERTDAMMRRVFLAIEPPTNLALPPDLVMRAVGRLPTATPAAAAKLLARSHARRRVALWSVATPVTLIALLSLFGVAGWGTELALRVGDGSAGVSRLMLMLHLLAKPVLWTVSGVNPLLLLAFVLTIIAGVWLWWQTIRRTPTYVVVEDEE